MDNRAKSLSGIAKWFRDIAALAQNGGKFADETLIGMAETVEEYLAKAVSQLRQRDGKAFARQQADHWLEDMTTPSLDAKHVSLMAMATNCINYGAALTQRPPEQAGAEIRAITAEMRRFMPNACGDWADKIDAVMLKEKARKVAFYDEPGHDIRPGETLPDRDRRIYQQGRHDALNDEPEAFI